MDVLGFSARVDRDFTGTVRLYDKLISKWRWHYHLSPEVSLQIYSDALLVSCLRLADLLPALSALHQLTLTAHCLVRGGVGYGHHVEVIEGNNVFVVSEALTEAVAMEKKIKHPCIALSPRIKVPEALWSGWDRNIDRPIVFFQRNILVNPLGPFWFPRALRLARQLSKANTCHASKYAWLLHFLQAIIDDVPLVPNRSAKIVRRV